MSSDSVSQKIPVACIKIEFYADGQLTVRDIPNEDPRAVMKLMTDAALLVFNHLMTLAMEGKFTPSKLVIPSQQIVVPN